MTEQSSPEDGVESRSTAHPESPTASSKELDQGAATDRSGQGGKGGKAELDGQADNGAGGAAEEGSEDDGEDDEDDDEDDDDDSAESDEEYEEEDEEEDEEVEEPRLKCSRLTQHLGSLYRNGDATSTFLVAGDKMIVGTHEGSIHVVQLPMFQSLRAYRAHSASVTAISISPYPPPLPNDRTEHLLRPPHPAAQARPSSRQSDASPAAASRRSREPHPIPKIPSNDLYIATSSIDGNVCVQSLVEPKDVQLRSFARPVQAVALSPEYKSDRTYLSGGLAGQLILTVGGGPGRSTSTTIGTAAATASGWLGSIGLNSNSGKDTVLHSGEGTISCIKWSLSGKYVVWLNEHGIKIMRSKLHLESADSEDAWKRIGHIDRPQTDEWETMAGVWKGRVEWIDEKAIEADEPASSEPGIMSPATQSLKEQSLSGKRNMERLLVGWGGTIWIIHIHPGSMGIGKNAAQKSAGRAEIVKKLRMDCIISGISLHTQSLLLVLAYNTPNDDDDDDDDDDDEGNDHQDHGASTNTKTKGHASKASTSSNEPSGGLKRRQNNLPPDLRLIDFNSGAEVNQQSLPVTRYERLGSSDYHLGVLPARNVASVVASSKGTLEALAGLGTDMWHAAINPKSLFSSGASVRSKESGDDASISTTGVTRAGIRPVVPVPPGLSKPGAKIFIHSPYDCIVATKCDLSDHFYWLVERKQYQSAWELLDDNPDILSAPEEVGEKAASTSKQQGGSDDFFDDESAIDAQQRNIHSNAEKEKRHIGKLWIQELVERGDWVKAGEICGKVLTTADQWEKWVWKFAGAQKFDEISNYMPSQPMHPPLSTTIYEVVLGHYIQNDKPGFRDLLNRWSTDLFDINTVVTALDNQLKFRDVREDSVEDGEKGRDWRIVMESLARLHEANGRQREALRCYIRLQDADSVFRLIRDSHLADAVTDDVAGFITLRVSPDLIDNMSQQDFEDATADAITLLVDEAQHGLVRPHVVVDQLLAKELRLYLFFYLRGLWKGEGIQEHTGESYDRLVMDSQSLVDDFADLAVQLFARYDRKLLMEFLKSSTSYGFEKAVHECEGYNYYDELVFLYSKTGQTKRALYLIIDRLKDVHKAIEFAKEQDDPDLWEDILEYSMDKPSFIRGLLEQVGTAVNPITLVRRIPEGLEIEGLREGLTRMMKEHEIQYSISSGVARVLRSEVAAAQRELRAGQRKGIKFEVVVRGAEHVDVEVKDVPTTGEVNSADAAAASVNEVAKHENLHRQPDPGHCAQCHEPFVEDEIETLLGFACGHAFHVSHLLEMLHKGKKVDVDLGVAAYEGGGRHLVGTKVMRARLLRDKVRDGCPLCHVN